MKKLVLIDSNALVHRAFHALPPTLVSPKGLLTNAVYGFTSVLFKMLKELKPDYIAATFDLAGPTIRHEEFAEYKSHRIKAPDELYQQIPLIKKILESMGITIFEKQGYEADDLIGTLTQEGKKEKDIQVIIVTGDLDTLQLVEGDKVVVFTLKKGITDTFTYNEKEVKERYSLSPGQMNDYKGLKGDPSDNIPGVPGIGEKTAAALIGEYKDLEKLYEKVEKYIAGDKKKKLKVISDKLAEKLIENKDQAFFSKKLSTIYCNLEVGFNIGQLEWRKKLDIEKLSRLLRELGFGSLIKRLDDIDTGRVEAVGLFPEERGETGIKELKTKQEIKNALNEIKKSSEIVLDIRGGFFNFTIDGKQCFSFNLEDLKEARGGAELWKQFVEIADDKGILKSGHNLKNVEKSYLQKGIRLKGLNFDSQIAAYLLNSGIKDYSLDKIYFNEFEKNIDPDSKAVPLYIFQLKESLSRKMKGEGLLGVFADIEMPLIKVLAEMELAGIKIDTEALKNLSKLVNKELLSLEKKIYKLAGTKFNINSPQQLKEVLFERLQIKGKVRKTSKGALSTAASELEKLAGENKIIDLILRYRELQKLKGTYIEPFPGLINKETGRLSTTFNQTGTSTGRLSSQDPNLQNIPSRTELGQEFRKAFIADPGYKLISFDYSQLDLKIAAHISRDKKMISAFNRGEDIHTRTAAEIFGVDASDVTKDMRRQAKVLNFGILYGMGTMGFQRAAGVDRATAKNFIDRYKEEFSGVAKYMEDTKELARKQGYVSTIFGRKRSLPEIRSGIPEVMHQAERMAINMPIQGTASDLLKMSMIKIYDLMHSKFKDNEVRMPLQIHDELLFEVKNTLVDSTVVLIKEIMESIYKLEVPLTVDVKCGDNWKDMKLL